MAFADGILKAHVSLSTLATEIEKHLTDFTQTFASPAATTTSGTVAAISGSDATLTVNSGEVVLVYAFGTFSVNARTAPVVMEVQRSGSMIHEVKGYEPLTSANTSGNNFTLSKMAVDTPGAGSVTYRLGWYIEGRTTETAYCSATGLLVFGLQNS